jgi:hypothetical protein
MKEIVTDFKAGNIDVVYLAYNEFKSVIAQNRIIEPVLPIDPSTLIGEESEADESIDYIYEPGVESILDDLLPLHLNMQLWTAVLESSAAEQGARMTAMDNATENAKELERDLGLLAVMAISIGAMVGSGIFILPGLAMKMAGPAVVFAYFLAGVLVLPAALSKSEMATAMPEAGGTYLYIERAMGPLFGTIAGVGTWFSLTFKGALALVGGGGERNSW